jgi:hypothetical protein
MKLLPRAGALTLAALLLPNLAWAHGEQVLLIFWGNAIALLAAPVIAWKMVRGIAARAAVFLGTPAACVAVWGTLLSSNVSRDLNLMNSGVGLVVAGLLPLAGSLLVGALLRRLHPACRPVRRPF